MNDLTIKNIKKIDAIVRVKKLHYEAKVPVRAHEGDAGADLYALEDGCLLPGQRMLVDTGISVEIPAGWYGRIAPRSGLAVKNGIDVLAGVVDSGYRGPLKVCLINLNNGSLTDAFYWKTGDRIAQLIIERCADTIFEEVTDLDQTSRATGGFGSTGTS